MEEGEFERVAASFAVFHQVFAPLFGRREAQERSEQYVRGLLVQQTDRRNAENLAESIAGATPRALQRLLTESPWRSEPVLARLQTYLGERLNTPEGIFVLDESGFPKQGRHSVGVAPQYCGVLGKVANCQMGVFLAYASARGHALVDTRLFLPERWTQDAARCQAAGVPAAVSFQSKAALALAMLRQARAHGQLQGRRVTGDDAYGEVPSLRDALDAEDWEYVLEVPSTTSVFRTLPALVLPEHTGRGRRYTVPRLAPEATPAQAVTAVAASLAPGAWQDLTVADGAQGPRTYQFAALRVWESRGGLPGRPSWLLLRRNLDGSEPRSYLANLPPDTSLLTLAQIAAARWVIETDFKTAKGEAGLDDYEVRSWQGWHHHITLVLLAAAFLLTLQQEWGEMLPQITPTQISRLLRALLPHRHYTTQDLRRWLSTTQARNERAKHAPHKRRLALQRDRLRQVAAA
jgi:SRSO17 transposase